jgi:chromosome segregation ATPase
MEQLAKLESKIREIVNSHQDLQKENGELRAELRGLKDSNLQLEEALLKKTEKVGELTVDQESTKVAIDELVTSLNALSSPE